MSVIDSLDENNTMDKIVLFALDEARTKLEESGGFEPFSVIVRGDDLYVENHPGETPIECFNSARSTLLNMSSLTEAYVFCYDGYVSLDSGVHDAIVAERAGKNDDIAQTFAIIYEIDQSGEGSIIYDDNVYSLGETTSLLAAGEFTAEQFEDLDEAHEHGTNCGCGHEQKSDTQDESEHNKHEDAKNDSCSCDHD